MRIATTLALLAITAVANAQTPPPAAPQAPADPNPEQRRLYLDRPDITVEQAEKDIQQNRFRIYSYGLVPIQNYEIARILQKDYGIQQKSAAGCIVSGPLATRIRAYNECMKKAILKKYGKTYSELYEEARQKLRSK